MVTSVKTLSVLALGTILSTGLATSANAAIISNGTIQLEVNSLGNLGPDVGLKFLPTGADAITPGCFCEGWGVADASTGLTGYANFASGTSNLNLVSFNNTASTATSIVKVADNLRITHNYVPSVTPFLYKTEVTIDNPGSALVGDLRYRRVMDWDVPPTPFSEFVTLNKGSASNILFTSDQGFASADPLSARGSISFIGEAVDSGPADHGALFDFGFGSLAAGASKTFNIFYGAAPDEATALAALGNVGAEAYSFGQPSSLGGATTGAPNTFIFAFAGVGGAPVVPPPASEPVPEPLTILGSGVALGFGALMKKQHSKKLQKMGITE